MAPIMIRKKYGYRVAVTNGSRRVIGCSKASWQTLREGSFIAIAGSSMFYRIFDKKQYTYTKNSEFIDDSTLKIEGHTGYNVMIDDLVSFTDVRQEGDITIPEERTVSSIEHKEDHTIIRLSHPLPPHTTSGTITVKKWEAILDSEYLGDSRNDASYEIVKDFTPNLDLPLIKGEIISSSLLYNESMVILDKKIQEIEGKLDKLTKEQ